MKQRKIDIYDIFKCIYLPQKIEHEGRKIKFYRSLAGNKYVVICVCIIENDECRIITIYKAGRPYRYINPNQS
ncbi:DUF4258 domain-containing protein [Candidatus Peregrinibacteria bacterium]|nr:DUF4258 domain-containing protein [Candidatus Peregrinibacteria bacterium]